jgi:small subunit ribosomal protein S9
METKKSLSKNIHSVGRRKKSIARVWMKTGSGDISINGKNYKKYFDTDNSRLKVELPLKVTSLGNKFDINININGGGMAGQADAVKLGIARALLITDEKFRKVLRKNKLLTVDSRVKERKKYGQKGARAKFQFVKR